MYENLRRPMRSDRMRYVVRVWVFGIGLEGAAFLLILWVLLSPMSIDEVFSLHFLQLACVAVVLNALAAFVVGHLVWALGFGHEDLNNGDA